MPTISLLEKEIQSFVGQHPEGWGHGEWLSFLHHLRDEGLEISNPDSIGLALEKERVRSALRGIAIRGLGPKRVESIADGFGTFHELLSVDARGLAGRTGIPMKIAQEVVEKLG
jgi:excinuclease UvrABC nuclease subunit